MAHLAGLGLTPRVLPSKTGDTIIKGDAGHFVRLLTWLPGEPLGTLGDRSRALFEDFGSKLGQVSRALASFDHPAAHRRFHWDLSSAEEIVRRYQGVMKDETLKALVLRLTGYVMHRDYATLGRLRRSVIHGDANDYNVLVDHVAGAAPSVSGFIDFGDMVFSYTAAEPAVAIAYAVLDQPDPLDVAVALTRGYHSANPLTEDEVSVLFGLVLLRLCMSASLAAHQQHQRPDDPYLGISQEPLRRTLPKLAAIPPDAAEDALRVACGFSKKYPQMYVPKGVTYDRRHERFGRNVSIAYTDPLKVSRGWMQYLFDEAGRRYLDAYNNVPAPGARTSARRERGARADAGRQHEHALLARRGLAVRRAPRGHVTGSAVGVLLRELGQRSERARPPPRSRLYRCARRRSCSTRRITAIRAR